MASGSREKKRKLSTSFSQPRSTPEDTVEEQTATLTVTRTALLCPICSALFREVYSAQCGHSFCFQCISVALQQSQHCPVCKTAVQALHPNFSLNDVVAKVRSQTASYREAAMSSHRVADILTLATDLSSQELSSVLRSFDERFQQTATREKQERTAVALSFIDQAVCRKEKELQRVREQLKVLNADRDRLVESASQAVLPGCLPPSDVASSQVAAPSTGSPAATLRVEANFEELLEDYFKIKRETREKPEGEESLKLFCEGLEKFTQFTSFRVLATLPYGEQTNTCCIVSSLAFDRDGDFFAVAGVTKKLKVFDYQRVVRQAGFTNHFPVQEMSCAAKLSCVAYNPYHKHQLLSSDYEGCVCVWDVQTGRRTALHQEHVERVWSVAYNPQEPTLFASGSDDCTVKLWSMGKATSIFSLSARTNVCSVTLNPHARYLLAYGSADAGVRYVDLRKPNQPVLELRGHKKTVSYLKFMSSTELVSASTDSERGSVAINIVQLQYKPAVRLSSLHARRTRSHTLRLWKVWPCTGDRALALTTASLRGTTRGIAGQWRVYWRAKRVVRMARFFYIILLYVCILYLIFGRTGSADIRCLRITFDLPCFMRIVHDR